MSPKLNQLSSGVWTVSFSGATTWFVHWIIQQSTLQLLKSQKVIFHRPIKWKHTQTVRSRIIILSFSHLLQASSLQALPSQLSPIICTSAPNHRMMVTLLSPHLHIRPWAYWNNQRRHLRSLHLQSPAPSRALRFSYKYYSVFVMSEAVEWPLYVLLRHHLL